MTSFSGSPTLARRAPRSLLLRAIVVRLTCTRAESAARTTGPRTCSTAHLRSRGKHRFVMSPVPRNSGSPPLVRRARRRTGRRDGPVRRAKSTPRTAASSTRGPAHLRLRGERSPATAEALIPSGLPPLTRRAQAFRNPAVPMLRLTSARAEKVCYAIEPLCLHRLTSAYAKKEPATGEAATYLPSTRRALCGLLKATSLPSRRIWIISTMKPQRVQSG